MLYCMAAAMNPFRYSEPVPADELIDRDAETATLVETAVSATTAASSRRAATGRRHC